MNTDTSSYQQTYKDQLTNDLAYIFGRRVEYYFEQYRKYKLYNGKTRIQWVGMNVSALFLGPIWYFYRKLYLIGFVLLLAPMAWRFYVAIEGVAMGRRSFAGIMLLSGWAANMLYVQHASSLIAKADRHNLTGQSREDYLRQAGDVSWFWGILGGLAAAVGWGLVFLISAKTKGQ